MRASRAPSAKRIGSSRNADVAKTTDVAAQTTRFHRLAPWWHRTFGIDLRSLAALRIALGAMVAVDGAFRAVDLTAHYTDAGTYPLDALKLNWDGSYWWMATLYAYDTGPTLPGILLALQFLAGVLLALGWQARFAAFLAWFLIVQVQNRNPIILHGGDQMLRIVAFWAMFLPVGARWSIDGAVGKLRAYGQPVAETTVSVGSFALLFQCAITYWSTAALKTGVEWGLEGSALWYALGIQQYETTIGIWIRSWPTILLRLMTWGTIGLEWAAPLAILAVPRPAVRSTIVLGMFAFHLLLITPMMDVGPISWESCLWWIPFLPGSFWDFGAKFAAPWVDRIGWTRLSKAVSQWRTARDKKWVAERKPFPRIDPSFPMQVAAALAIAWVVYWNAMGILDKPARFSTVNRVFRLDQHWAMFAPRPMKEDGWYIAAARLADGSIVDLFQGGKPATLAKPDYIPALYRNTRWAKHWMNLWMVRYAEYRRFMTAWMRTEWDRKNPDRKVVGMTLWFQLQITPPPGESRKPPEPIALWSEAAMGVPAPPIRLDGMPPESVQGKK